VYDTVSRLSPLAPYSLRMKPAIDPISSLLSCYKFLFSEGLLAVRNITKTNNMTTDMTPSEVLMGPELKKG
jgi:hypothetical protein